MHSKSRSLVLYALAILVGAVVCSVSFLATPAWRRLEVRATPPKMVHERGSHDYPYKMPSIQNRDNTNGTLHTCAIEGNADIYGIGIRVGFYLQVLASGIALAVRPDDAKGFFGTNAWFQIGLFVALIYNSANDSIYAVEGFIAVNMLYLLLWYNGALVLILLTEALVESMVEDGLISADRNDSQRSEREHVPKAKSENRVVSTARLEDSRLKDYGEGLIGFPRLSIYAIPVIGNMVLFAATQFYSTWFWWRGLSSLKPGPCSDRGFFFANVDLHGWFRWFHRILNLLMVAGWCFGVVLFVVVGLIFLFELWLYSKPGRTFGKKLESRYPVLERRRRHYGEFLAGKRKWWQVGDDDPDSEDEDLPPSHTLLDSGEPDAIPLQLLTSNEVIVEDQPQSGDRLLEDAARSIAMDHTPSGEEEISDQDPESPQFDRLLESRQENFEVHPDQPQFPKLAQIPLSINAERQGAPPCKNTDFNNTSSQGIAHDDKETTRNLAQIGAWASSLTLFLFNLLTIELSIRWNQITDVNKLISTGQLIPFVIGVGGMCRSCWIAGKRLLEIRQERKIKKEI
ncbi:hypothetical protein BKA64DRAFT_644296 [Cadophora sp. MPI-SDFR-AT-0126]|nr:hypothetical protein BKA64DRAFT_644296 [Leotiomycetes sp. MPI-SDFR-AT-0126]